MRTKKPKLVRSCANCKHFKDDGFWGYTLCDNPKSENYKEDVFGTNSCSKHEQLKKK